MSRRPPSSVRGRGRARSDEQPHAVSPIGPWPDPQLEGFGDENSSILSIRRDGLNPFGGRWAGICRRNRPGWAAPMAAVDEDQELDGTRTADIEERSMAADGPAVNSRRRQGGRPSWHAEGDLALLIRALPSRRPRERRHGIG